MIWPPASLPLRGLAPDEAAAYWLVRMDRGPLDEREQAAFDVWRLEANVNSEAFDRAQEMWNLFDHTAGDPHLDALRESALAVGPEPRGMLWLGLGAGIAASLLAVAFVRMDLFPLGHQGGRTVSAPAAALRLPTEPEQGDFATAKGEQRTIVLADGSSVTLNTDSAIRVDFAPDRRAIRMLRGQALFEVAKNRARPFIVQAGDREITALGTVFEVRLERDRMRVSLIEGKVVVDQVGGGPAGSAVIVPAVLVPGEELVATFGVSQSLAKIDADQQVRWREGYAEFSDVTLADAVAEMNRYSDHRLVIASPAIGNLRVSGIFRTGNPDRFAGIIGEMLPVQSRRLPDGSIELVGAAKEH